MRKAGIAAVTVLVQDMQLQLLIVRLGIALFASLHGSLTTTPSLPTGTLEFVCILHYCHALYVAGSHQQLEFECGLGHHFVTCQ